MPCSSLTRDSAVAAIPTPPAANHPALLQESGRVENLVGWYHSHPGYGCWLSGIDVGTQMTNQKYQVGLDGGVKGGGGPGEVCQF